MKNVIILTLLILVGVMCYSQKAERIIISKKKLELYAIGEKGDTLCCFKCAVGVNYGDKQRTGDKRTPEGKFSVASIENSSKWTFDFNDGAGQREGAYGPYFIRLKTQQGWKGIGIHGTCFPKSIGKRDTRGCVRLLNKDLVVLKQYIEVGTTVIIEKDS
ncbi:MAG: L,D-transpeptidase [Bacteroidales bacterium]|nr:L,D-transpeptidase [Bacteroidales bacterium]